MYLLTTAQDLHSRAWNCRGEFHLLLDSMVARLDVTPTDDQVLFTNLLIAMTTIARWSTDGTRTNWALPGAILDSYEIACAVT